MQCAPAMIIMVALHWMHTSVPMYFLYLKSQNGHSTPGFQAEQKYWGLETTLILVQDMQSETVIQIIKDAESKNYRQQYSLYFINFHSALLS